MSDKLIKHIAEMEEAGWFQRSDIFQQVWADATREFGVY